jgi:succinate dehydrogenase / fumarate reductase membrane anchor subunit
MSGRTTDSTLPAAWDPPAPETAVASGRSRWLAEYALMRVTGLVLAVLALGHFAVTHLVTDVAGDNSAFVARRLSSGLWTAWDAALLAAALAHGTVGARLALAELTSRRAAKTLERAVGALAVGLFVVGAIAIARAAHA